MSVSPSFLYWWLYQTFSSNACLAFCYIVCAVPWEPCSEPVSTNDYVFLSTCKHERPSKQWDIWCIITIWNTRGRTICIWMVLLKLDLLCFRVTCPDVCTHADPTVSRQKPADCFLLMLHVCSPPGPLWRADMHCMHFPSSSAAQINSML